MMQKQKAIDLNPHHRAVDVLIAAPLVALLTPIWALNCALSLLNQKTISQSMVLHDALDRAVKVSHFTCGFARESLSLLSVLRGKLHICGLSTRFTLDDQYHHAFANRSAGLFSLFDLYQWVGLIDKSHADVLNTQFKSESAFAYFALIVKVFMAYLFYSDSTLRVSKTFSLFGIRINNVDLTEFIQWLYQHQGVKGCKTAFFVNVNSINIALNNETFKTTLHAADRIFADGSGVRMAAAHTGEKLIANINGTDLLPHICTSLVQRNKSIFLLGSEPGVAQRAAENLAKEYSGLRIAGVYHGYFSAEENESVIDKINNSGADICLVAMGSPLQENWLVENAYQLHCSTALAVGGLFDFYSGKIPRAPRWMREIGMEWVWRLVQEPSKKFNRYIIGNPSFLIRTFLLNQARG